MTENSDPEPSLFNTILFAWCFRWGQKKKVGERRFFACFKEIFSVSFNCLLIESLHSLFSSPSE